MEERVQSPKVLCIEDEPEVIDLIRLILERKGYQVIGALGGRQALEILQQEKPDLVLLDLAMPEVDGWEVFHYMKADAALRDIPVIVVTARDQGIDKVIGLHIAKVDAYITKPFGPGELVKTVEEILQKSRKLNSSSVGERVGG